MIIGLAGKKRSGKTSFAKWIEAKCDNVQVFAFADPVYDAVQAIIGPIYDSEKEVPIDWLGGITPRRMLQTLGTEWARDLLHKDFWLMCMRKRLQPCMTNPDNVVIIPDVRFENEAAMIRELGGVIVHVVRKGDSSDEHVSEAGIKFIHGEIVAYNYGDLDSWNEMSERVYKSIMRGLE